MGLAGADQTAEVTIVVVPREKYHLARSTLTHLLALGGPPFDLVYVDEGRAPGRLRRWIRAEAARAGFRHVPLPHHAGANECRQRGFEVTTTPYTLLIDNDARLSEDGLAALLRCAEETGAAFVSPIYLNTNGTIHYAGGVARVVEEDGRRRLVEEPRAGGSFAEVRGGLTRQRIDAPEMHGVLVRAASLSEVGGLDAELTSSMDCLDLGLRLQGIGGGGWIEPGATITYDGAMPRLSDLPLYLSRWSRASIEHDIARFAAMWRLDPTDERFPEHRYVLSVRRWKVTRYVRGAVRRTLGLRAAALVEGPIDAVVDRFSNVR